MSGTLGIIAGGGELPGLLARCAGEQGRKVFIVALEHQADPAVVEPFDHRWVRLGAAATAIAHLRRENVEDVVLAGPVRRPSMSELMPDLRAARFLASGALSKGDDGLLSSIIRLLEEEEGFRVVGVPDVLGSLAAPEGNLTMRAPDDREEADISRGKTVLEALDALDIGQAAAVQQGVVLGLEAVEGTDALIRRAGELRRPGPGPVLVKFSKTNQDLRADQPTIGPATVEGCAAAGFSGIAVEAKRSLIVGRDEVVAAAERHGLFLKALSR